MTSHFVSLLFVWLFVRCHLFFYAHFVHAPLKNFGHLVQFRNVMRPFWGSKQTHTHKCTQTCPNPFLPHTLSSPGQQQLPEWSMSLSPGPASWAPGGAAELLCPGYGLTLADAGWVMSACYSQEGGGGCWWRGKGGHWGEGVRVWGTGDLARPKGGGPGERSLLSLLWLIRQEAKCPQCHYRYPWPPAAPPTSAAPRPSHK